MQIQNDMNTGFRAGLDAQDRFIAKKGLIIGQHGSQHFVNSPTHVSLFDDFTGTAILGDWTLLEGTDSATSAEVITAVNGGVLRITTGDAGTGLAADMAQVSRLRCWAAANGDLCFETRIQLSAITTCYAFVGFTDILTLEAPIESAAAADTLTSNADDAVGFMFDTRMTTDTWWLTGVKAGTDATAQDTTYAPVAATYETLRVELTAAGVATFFRNGKQVGTAMSAAVTAATLLTPTICVSKTSVAASMTADIDYIACSMNRV